MWIIIINETFVNLHFSGYGTCQPCTTIQMQNDFDYTQQRMYFSFFVW